MSTNYRITFDQAVDYIQAYVDKFNLNTAEPSLMNSIGGTLKVNRIKTQIEYLKDQRKPDNIDAEFIGSSAKTYQGLMCWFCHLADSANVKEHNLLAIEANDEVDIESDPSLTTPDQPRLARPFDIIIYDKNSHNNIAQWLKTKRPLVSLFPNSIEKGSSDNEGVKKLIKQFQSKISGLEPSNEKRPYGLFENQSTEDVDDFLIGEVKFIRYYFGYDKKSSENKIRVILFGVDDKGNNLIPEDLSSTKGALLGGPIILQTSWPPKLP